MISGANEKQLELANARADILLLQQENQELKKQLEDLQETHYLIQGGRSNGKTYLMKLQADKEQLNSLVNSCQEEIRRLKKQLEVGEEQYNDLVEEKEKLQKQLTTHQILQRDCYVNNLKNISKIEEMENQQKEFIEFITSYIELLSNKPDLIEESEIDLLKEILSKYKETIGVSNEN